MACRVVQIDGKEGMECDGSFHVLLNNILYPTLIHMLKYFQRVKIIHNFKEENAYGPHSLLSIDIGQHVSTGRF